MDLLLLSPFGTMSTTIVVVLGRLSVVCVLVWVVVVLKEVVVGTISSEISHVPTSKEHFSFVSRYP